MKSATNKTLPERRDVLQRTAPAVRLNCTYCHDGLTRGDVAYCGDCLAPHHRDCFEQDANCSAPGCVGNRFVSSQPVKRKRRALGVLTGVLLMGGATLAGWAPWATESRRPDLRPATVAEFDDASHGSVPRAVSRRFSAVERRVEVLRSAERVAEADRLAKQLRQLREQLQGTSALPDGREAELHVVGLYEAQGEQNAIAEVHLERTGRPVVLALCSYSTVFWRVHVAPGVQLERVLVGGYEAQHVGGLPPGVVVETYIAEDGARDFFQMHSRTDSDYTSGVAMLQRLTGRAPTTFLGSYSYEAPIVVGRANQTWRAEYLEPEIEALYRSAVAESQEAMAASLKSHRFWAIQAKDRRASLRGATLTRFGVTGPNPRTAIRLDHDVVSVAVDAVGHRVYGLGRHEIVSVEVDKGTTKTIPWETRRDLPRLSWPSGIAFDAKRKRLWVVSSHGGYLFAYDPAGSEGQRWTAVDKLDEGFHSLAGLAYDAEGDALYSVGGLAGEGILNHLVRFDPQSGKQIASVPFSEEIVVASQPSVLSHSVQLVALASSRLVILLPKSAHVVDPRTGNVLFSTQLESDDEVLEATPSVFD